MAHSFAANRDPVARGNGIAEAFGTLTVSSYTAAGEVLAASDFLLGGTLKDVQIADAISSAGYLVRFDRATLKLRAYKVAAGAITAALDDGTVTGGNLVADLTVTATQAAQLATTEASASDNVGTVRVAATCAY